MKICIHFLNDIPLDIILKFSFDFMDILLDILINW
jgi:hypothetical protein